MLVLDPSYVPVQLYIDCLDLTQDPIRSLLGFGLPLLKVIPILVFRKVKNIFNQNVFSFAFKNNNTIHIGYLRNYFISYFRGI